MAARESMPQSGSASNFMMSESGPWWSGRAEGGAGVQGADTPTEPSPNSARGTGDSSSCTNVRIILHWVAVARNCIVIML